MDIFHDLFKTLLPKIALSSGYYIYGLSKNQQLAYQCRLSSQMTYLGIFICNLTISVHYICLQEYL